MINPQKGTYERKGINVQDESRYLKWKEHRVKTVDLELSIFEIGVGPVIIFLSGGPGDDHSYLRSIAIKLAPYFHCVLYDQRGCGKSKFENYNNTTFHFTRFLSDLDSIREHLGKEKVCLVGHSWGATLALLYSIYYPTKVVAVSLVGLGTINQEQAKIAVANLNQALSPSEKKELAEIRQQRNALTEKNEFEAYRDLHVRSFEIGTRRSFYSPLKAAEIVKQLGIITTLTQKFQNIFYLPWRK